MLGTISNKGRKPNYFRSAHPTRSQSSLAVRFQRNRTEKEKLQTVKSFPRRKYWYQFLSFLNPCVLRHFSTLPKTKTMGSSTCMNFSHSYVGPRTAGNRLNIDKFHEKGRWQHINYEEGWVVTKS